MRDSKGRLVKGCISPMKGKKHSEETKKKMSKSQKGKKLSEERKNKLIQSSKPFKKGHIPWNKGKVFSEETRKKMSASAKGRIPWNKQPDIFKNCLVCGKKFKIRVPAIKERSKYCSIECKDKSPRNHKTKSGIREDIGHFMRSTWEANIARIFQYENIDYIYEPKRFDLGELGTYLPDFYIPQSDYYIEVKGYWYNQKSKDKVEKFKENHDLIIIEKDEYKNLSKTYTPVLNNWEISRYDY